MRSHRVYNKARQYRITSHDAHIFPTNFIKTSKYTKWNFLPKSIILQFQRLANIYFLITAVLQCIDVISSLNPVSAVAPFIIVIALSVIREGIEDIPRQNSDKKVNSSIALLLNKEGHFQGEKWADIKVGDILLIKDGEEFPADLILLKSAHDNGLAYIETASLDGERNLKPKYAMVETSGYFHGQAVKHKEIYTCSIYAQAPDPSIYRFEGAFINEEGTKTTLTSKQFLLRGARLKNVEWVLGVTVYTGHDTKLMRNSEKSKTKQSRIEHTMNNLIIAILVVQMIFCSAAAIGNRIWNGLYLEDHWYLPNEINLTREGFYTFLSYFILTNTMIPISLIVTIEIVKFIQALFIQADNDMYNENKQKGAKVFTSSINEELGLVDYIFSDKTGTLTSNEMVFKNFVIGKEVYGEDKPKVFVSTIDLDDKDKDVRQNNQQEPAKLSESKLVDIKIQQLLLHSDTSNPMSFSMLGSHGQEALNLKNQKELVAEFMQALSTCHECLAEKDREGNILYQGQSQDEMRLVETASNVGFKFLGGSLRKVQVEMLGTIKDFDILQAFDFTSDRKRMSILIKDGDVMKLYMKGADNVILERLRRDDAQPCEEFVTAKLEEYSRQGYRTLVYAMKIVTEEEYKKLMVDLEKIAADVDREEKTGLIADEFERGLYLIGCSAVEDKLQDNVPKVINDFLRADIKVWMLTGDKLETAENIAHSCRLIRGDMNVMRCFGKTPEAVKAKLEENKEVFDLCIKEGRKKAYIVEGDALTYILHDPALKEAFTQIVLYCDAVVCCRAAPKQKAEMVRIVRTRTNKVTLAIGDGANDVNMIQAANIGIGLYGHEGVQAVQASDYAIPEFQALWKLLMVHGRWSYIRIAEMILYFFYKNMLFTLPQFYFTFINGFSAMTIYDDYYVSGYNLVFTALPLGVKAILEKDVDYKIRLPVNEVTAEKCYVEDKKIKRLMPSLYGENKKNLIFTYPHFIFWVLKGVVMAVLLFVFVIEGVEDHIINEDGISASLWFSSITLYTSVILVVTVKLCVQTRYWNIIFVGCLAVLSLGIYLAFTLIYDTMQGFRVSGTVGMNYESVLFYANIIFFTGFELLIDLSREMIRKIYKPTSADTLRTRILKEKKTAHIKRSVFPSSVQMKESINLPGGGNNNIVRDSTKNLQDEVVDKSGENSPALPDNNTQN